MEPFQLDFASISIQIDSNGARYAETDVRNGGIYDNLYSTTDNPDLKEYHFENRLSYKQMEHTIG